MQSAHLLALALVRALALVSKWLAQYSSSTNGFITIHPHYSITPMQHATPTRELAASPTSCSVQNFLHNISFLKACKMRSADSYSIVSPVPVGRDAAGGAVVVVRAPLPRRLRRVARLQCCDRDYLLPPAFHLSSFHQNIFSEPFWIVRTKLYNENRLFENPHAIPSCPAVRSHRSTAA